jgi:hypothetical protein
MDSSNRCDMYMCSLRHTHDPLILSLNMEGIRLLFYHLHILGEEYRLFILCSNSIYFSLTLNSK